MGYYVGSVTRLRFLCTTLAVTARNLERRTFVQRRTQIECLATARELRQAAMRLLEEETPAVMQLELPMVVRA